MKFFIHSYLVTLSYTIAYYSASIIYNEAIEAS